MVDSCLLPVFDSGNLQLQKQTQGHFKPGGSMYMPYKEGLLKLEGTRQKIYFATKGDMLAYYKSSHEFNFGQPIARLVRCIITSLTAFGRYKARR